MWKYCGESLNIWKCPGDKSQFIVNGQAKPRVRSMSMNLYLGGWGGTDGGWGAQVSAYKIYRKYAELNDPGPTKTFVFLDMREDSIDMGNFAVNMAGWPDRPSLYRFWDLPGFFHHRACGFSFADGHSEIHKWHGSRIRPPVTSQLIQLNVTAGDSKNDILWLSDVTTVPK
jgi:hypothetical protein